MTHAIYSSTYLHQQCTVGRLGNDVIALFSRSFITKLATTTDTGDPIAVPWICRYYLPWHWISVEFRQKDNRVQISVGIRAVHSLSCTSALSRLFATSTSIFVGIDVNNETTSNVNSSFGSNFLSVAVSTKRLVFPMVTEGNLDTSTVHTRMNKNRTKRNPSLVNFGSAVWHLWCNCHRWC